MPIPGGEITTSQIWVPEPVLEDAPLPEAPEENVQKDEQ